MLFRSKASQEAERRDLERSQYEMLDEKDLAREVKRLEKLMLEHARQLEFEQAARVRDQLARLREQALGGPGHDAVIPLSDKARK